MYNLVAEHILVTVSLYRSLWSPNGRCAGSNVPGSSSYQGTELWFLGKMFTLIVPLSTQVYK